MPLVDLSPWLLGDPAAREARAPTVEEQAEASRSGPWHTGGSEARREGRRKQFARASLLVADGVDRTGQ